MSFARRRGLVAALAGLALVLALATAGHAQLLPGNTGFPLVTKQRAVVEALALQVGDLEKRLGQQAESDAGLVELRLQLEEAGRALLESGLAFRPRLAEINVRVEQLGPAPAEGQPPEPDIVRHERDRLLAEKAEINAALGVAENLSVRVNGLVERITEMRRDLFARLFTKRYEINYGLLGEVLQAAQTETADLYRSVSSWLRFVFQFKLKSVLAATFCALLAAALLLIGGRRAFGRIFVEPTPDSVKPTTLARLSVAFWSTLVPSAALGAFLFVTYLLYDYFGVLRGDIGAMLVPLFQVIGIAYFVYRLSWSVLSPDFPSWRLVRVRSDAAKPLVLLILLIGLLHGTDYLLNQIYQVLGSPLALTVGESLIATVLIGLLVILAARLQPFATPEGRPKPWPLWFRSLLYLLGAATLAAAVSGFIGLARFISQQIVITGAVVAMMYIGFLSARAIAEEGTFAGTGLGQRLKRWFQAEEAALDQLGLVVAVAINLGILLVGLPLLLLQWGFQPGDIEAWVLRVATGFQIGSVSVSLIGIFTGLLVFVLGYFATRWFQGWLDGSVMARGRVDLGVRNSIRLVVGYAGIALAALIGISAAGIDLSNLALVAGALSLGIGFGLQNVVSNFVSGLILLAERPLKVGDWITAGSVSGTVRKISVRATELETFQRQTVILPNSELINSAVGNWTHRNRLGRVDIKVGIAYGSDARRAHAVMLQIARAHPLVLRNPEPFVLFSNFALAAIEFEIRVFIADILDQNTVQNDIRFAVLEAYDRGEIDIPSAPRAMEVRKPPELTLEEETAVLADPQEERGVKAGRRRSRKPDPD